MMRRRGWECALDLLENYDDRLTRKTYFMCMTAAGWHPDRLDPRRAKRLLRLHRRLVPART